MDGAATQPTTDAARTALAQLLRAVDGENNPALLTSPHPSYRSKGSQLGTTAGLSASPFPADGSPLQRLAGPRKRSLTLRGHRTSISLEEAFWLLLNAMARARGLSKNQLVSTIDEARPPEIGLSGAIRVAILLWLAEDAADVGK